MISKCNVIGSSGTGLQRFSFSLTKYEPFCFSTFCSTSIWRPPRLLEMTQKLPIDAVCVRGGFSAYKTETRRYWIQRRDRRTQRRPHLEPDAWRLKVWGEYEYVLGVCTSSTKWAGVNNFRCGVGTSGPDPGSPQQGTAVRVHRSHMSG